MNIEYHFFMSELNKTNIFYTRMSYFFLIPTAVDENIFFVRIKSSNLYVRKYISEILQQLLIIYSEITDGDIAGSVIGQTTVIPL